VPHPLRGILREGWDSQSPHNSIPATALDFLSGKISLGNQIIVYTHSPLHSEASQINLCQAASPFALPLTHFPSSIYLLKAAGMKFPPARYNKKKKSKRKRSLQ
jgi:hypothetical protein